MHVILMTLGENKDRILNFKKCKFKINKAIVILIYYCYAPQQLTAWKGVISHDCINHCLYSHITL